MSTISNKHLEKYSRQIAAMREMDMEDSEIQ